MKKKKVLESVSSGTVKTRYVTSGLHNSSLKIRMAQNKLNLAIRRTLTNYLCKRSHFYIRRINKHSFSSNGKATPPPGMTKC